MPTSGRIDLKTTPTYFHVGYIKGIEFLGIGRYANPSNVQSLRVDLCQLCGSIVFEKGKHTKWHEDHVTA